MNKIRVNKMMHVPASPFNVISTTKRQLDGWIMTGTDEHIELEKNGHKMKFDIKINTPEGAVFAIYLKKREEQSEILNPSVTKTDKAKKISIKQAHDKFGHMGEALTRKATAQAGYTIT
jgi:hypothetical protein